jgi:hypothetical protein
LSDTHAFARMLQDSWSEITGWGLILSGLSLATWALGDRGGRRLPQLGPPEDSGARMLPMRAVASPRRLDRAEDWKVLMQIAERGFLCIEMLADMQDRAREEVEAADEVLSQLLAECASVLVPADAAAAVEGGPAELGAPVAEPAPASRPLAA